LALRSRKCAGGLLLVGRDVRVPRRGTDDEGALEVWDTEGWSGALRGPGLVVRHRGR
jgi:hypothetical protein